MKAAETPRRRVGKPSTVKPEAPNLISSWRAIVTRGGGSLTEALAVMNTVLGMNFTHSRIAQWERGEKTPSGPVIDYMLATVVPALLVEQGLSDSKAREIAGKVSLPEYKPKKPDREKGE